MAEESYITQEDLTSFRAADPRWKAVELSIRIDTELRDSLALNLVIEASYRHGDEAKDALANVDPTDTKKIISLQADIQRAKLIREILINIKNNGDEAYKSLMTEQKLNSENRSE